ncbi:MAG: type II 3-dehydroquinate dehydratase [Parvularculaceae bacterium]
MTDVTTAPDSRSPAGGASKGDVYVLNGPNLNLLGSREPEIYGRETLADIEAACGARCAELGYGLVFRQSNAEGALVDGVQDAAANGAALILNPGAYAHTSIALHDALRAVAIPKVEVHLSNVHAREAFRRRSYAAAACDGVLCGFGADGYALALDAAVRLIEKRLKNQPTG